MTLDAPTRPRRPLRAWPVLGAILLLALAIRLPVVIGRGLVGDEIFTLDLVRLPPGAMLEAIRADLVHPPLYFLVESPMVALLGDQPWALRALSLLAGLALVGLAWRWARVILGPPAGLAAALLAACALPLVLQSANARGYSLYALLVAGFALRLEHLRREEDGAAGWLVLGLLGTLAVATHYVAALYLLAGFVAMLIDPDRRRLVPRYLVAMVAPVAALGLWIAWLVPAYRAAGDLAGNLSWMTPPGLFGLVSVFVRAAGPAPVTGGTRLVLVALMALAALALFLRWRGRHQRSALPDLPRLTVTAALAVLPPLMLFVLSRPPLGIDAWAVRHLVPSIVPVILLVTAAIAMVARDGHPLAWALVGPFVAFHVTAVAERMDRPTGDPIRGAAEVVTDPRLSGLPLRTTYVHGIAKPVNHYLGLASPGTRDTVLAIDATEPPGEFLLLLRPRVEPERAVLEALRGAGWADSTAWDSGGAFGIGVVVVRRTGQLGGKGARAAGKRTFDL